MATKKRFYGKTPDHPFPRAELCQRKPHLWKPISFSRTTVGEQCSRCGERRNRTNTEEEEERYEEWAAKQALPMKIHETISAYEKVMEGKGGRDAMLEAERFEDQHPDHVFVTKVDDNYFATSDLVFITHEDPEGQPDCLGEVHPHWMGVTAHLISPCSGEQAKFFLYPNDLLDLIDTLQTLKQKMLTYPHVRRDMRRAKKELK